MSCDHYPHKGRRTKRKLHGGPWAGQSIGFYECQDELVLTRPDGSYVGRYVVRQVPQRSRTVTKVVWETQAEKLARVRDELRRFPVI